MVEPLEKEPEIAHGWDVLPHFRRLVFKLSLGLMVVLAGVALLFGKSAAQGVMLGGTAAILGFEISLRTLRLEKGSGDKVTYRLSIWWLARMLAYMAALLKGYSLDTAQYGGLFGAIAGLFVVRIVVMVVGFTSLDLKKGSG